MPGLRKAIVPAFLTALTLLSGPVLSPRTSPDSQPGTAAAQSTPQTSLQRGLDLAVSQGLQLSTAMGVHVVELDSGETVYAYNADELRIIASNTKLFTTAAALDALGPGFFFETRFVRRGEVHDGTLRGDLGVVGGGDPHISGRDYDGDSYAVFRGWARELRAQGIDRVTGDLYLDNGFFESLQIHPDWPRDQLIEWYEAPVDALSFNDNCILVRVVPGRRGGQARIETVPNVPLFRVNNQTKTIPTRKGHRIGISRSGTLLTVTGNVWEGSAPFDTWVTVPDPPVYFGAALKDALRSEGIEVVGQLRPVRQLPGPLWERVAVHRTDLISAVKVTNKRSQNFYAEALAKQIGARRCREGSWREGVRAISEFAEGVGIPRGSFKMADGSGMSRGNRFTPRHLTLLLRHMFFHPAGQEFAQSLPYGGEDNGSWKRRLAQPPYRGNVFAKTGTLSGVSTLSGYAKAVSGKSYAFSVLINRASGDARGAQDRIVRALIDNG
ncbi:MAG TPA: D-alanyl-D-alanine carboxypeptidase/D-alanyl-D-alanine-endopeptidase [Thermoanaerobaculia bacterium]|nr:D-alanyl-D-alanine carboxypeptidase/D-alanyl-D-alanine-endopeptidase [Thermoanaerobaculia bacterium]